MRHNSTGISWSSKDGNAINFFSQLLGDKKMLTVGIITLTAGITFYLCQKNNYGLSDITTPRYPAVPKNTPTDASGSDLTFPSASNGPLNEEDTFSTPNLSAKSSVENPCRISFSPKNTLPSTSSSFDMLEPNEIPSTSTDAPKK